MLADDLAAILPELRRQAESRMRTPCMVVRDGELTTDPETGAALVKRDVVWMGNCRVQQREVLAQVDEAVAATVTTQRIQLHVPVDAGPFRVGDLALVGSRVFRVEGLHVKDEQTAQRLPVSETTSDFDAGEVAGFEQVDGVPYYVVGD
jgi:hypothetical protein